MTWDSFDVVRSYFGPIFHDTYSSLIIGPGGLQCETDLCHLAIRLLYNYSLVIVLGDLHIFLGFKLHHMPWD